MSNVKAIVAAHKPYWMPDDPVYLPVQVGAALAETRIPGFQPDDEGDNISARNSNYCELTALYWAWKNLDADALALTHYRRHFAARRARDKKARVATGADLARALRESPVLLPKPRRYFIETNYSQYVHAHHAEDLELTRELVGAYGPRFTAKFDEVMARTYGHRFNMFAMRRDLADEWCAWVFPVMFELEGLLDISGYTSYDARVFGFIPERLLDVWVEANGLPYAEMPVVNLENQHWVRKGASFVVRKFGAKA